MSQSESSLRDSILSRHSSGSKPGFHRVMSMSTTDTVSLCSDVTVDPVLVPSLFILGVFWFPGSCRTSFISPSSPAAHLARRGAGPHQPPPEGQLLTGSSEGQRISVWGDATRGEGKLKPGTGTVRFDINSLIGLCLKLNSVLG